jgi:hypothetical protein
MKISFVKSGIARVQSPKCVFCAATFTNRGKIILLSGVTKVEAMPNGAIDSDSDKRLKGKFAEALRHNGARGQVSG